MIERLIPKYPAFLLIGLVIVVTGVFVLMAGRDVLISVWVDKLFDGNLGRGGSLVGGQNDPAKC